MKDAELHFDDDKKVVIKSGRTKIDYFFTADGFVVHPGKSIVLPSEDLVLEVTQEDLENIIKSASTLGHKILEFRVKEGKLSLAATTPAVDTSNDMVIEYGDTEAEDGSFKIKFDHMKLIPGDYHITICSKGISVFQHKTRKVKTYIGLEKV